MRKIIIVVVLIILAIGGYLLYMQTVKNDLVDKNDIMENKKLKQAYFAGGCFWCVESSFEKYDGIIDVVSGYAGGEEVDPTYKEVSSSQTGHREAVKVIYDPVILDYNDLLEIFWRTANPTDDGGQYVDRGFQYTSAIFYTTEQEKTLAEKSKTDLEKSGRFESEIVTPVIAYTTFYEAEDYHQNYYKVNPLRYKFYTSGSGRKQFLEKIWGDDLDYELSTGPKTVKTFDGKELSELQYKVTQEDGTERAFDNEYWDNTEEGIYVDLISGEPLYSSKDKYKSGTGWPSFTKPIDKSELLEKEDRGFLGTRTEIRGMDSDAHIGHVFDDGPEDKGGLRYCMNSAALKFIPKADMEKLGYGEYLKLFDN